MYLASPVAIAFWSALNHHGLSDQVPRTVFILAPSSTPIPKRKFLIKGVYYQFSQCDPSRYFGIQEIWVNNSKISITDPERTLLDGLIKPQFFGDFTEVLSGFENYKNKLNLTKIIEYALKLDASTAKRLGWILDKIGISRKKLKKLSDIPVQRYQKLSVRGVGKGKINSYWHIIENI